MNARWDVAGFGAVAVDTIHYVDGPLSSGKARVLFTEVCNGGNVATALAAASRLGARAGFLGWLPSATQWAEVHRDLQVHGVDLSAARTGDGPPIRSTVIVDSEGERFIAFDDDTQVGPPADMDTALALSTRVLILDAYGASRAIAPVRAARAHGVDVVADIEWTDGTAVEGVIALANHLVVSRAFAASFTQVGEPSAAARRLWSDGRTAVVITDGARGAWLLESAEGEAVHVPAAQVKAVDTTGCGDVFHGAYCAGLAQRRSVRECVAWATVAAGISATAAGGRGHLPTAAEVETFAAPGT